MSDPNKQSLVRGFAMRVSSLMERAGISRAMGMNFGGKRDYYDSFGWDKTISADQIWTMFNRGGIARSVATAYPDATWGRPPTLFHPTRAGWNREFAKMAKTLDLWAALHRLDVMLNLGRYAVLLIGSDDGRDLNMPRAKGSKITFLEPYAEKDVTIGRWNTDVKSTRFGMPETYTVSPAKQNRAVGTGGPVMPVRASFTVHASRVIHCVRNPLENKVFGTPIFAPIWNYLTDLEKVLGSASESYWRVAYPGLHANVDPEMDLDADDEANLSAEIDEYVHQMRRFIRTRGVDVNAIAGQVANPAQTFDVLVTSIAGTTRIPKRVLLGSEAGQLASSQDKGAMAERVEEYRELHAFPNMLHPLLRYLNEYEVMSGLIDIDRVQVLWPDAYRQSPLERGQTAAQTARTMANIAKALESRPNMLSDAEVRRLIGMSTDENILEDDLPGTNPRNPDSTVTIPAQPTQTQTPTNQTPPSPTPPPS